MEYEPVIGLEVHAELATRSKMFCGCEVVDSIQAEPNVSVCPVCEGLPGALPVVNQQAVEFALRVGLSLECSIARTSIFARKNYFYPDLPKGYQISQYEFPVAEHGRLTITTSEGEKVIRVTRAHLEEDAGKLTHGSQNGKTYSLVDLNRAGVPLLEIVSEPDMRSLEEAVAYGRELRSILRYLGVNSGDMEKGVIRFEANISVRPKGSETLGTRVEIKNLNSFKTMEKAVTYEIERQIALIESGGTVQQETVGWDEANGKTYSMRSKEDAHDYRYFPEPDLPPLVIDEEWIERVKSGLPELPRARKQRFQEQFELSALDAGQLVEDQAVARYFEECTCCESGLTGKMIANWVTGELFAWMNQSGETIDQVKVTPSAFVSLLKKIEQGHINQSTAKNVLAEMLQSGHDADSIISSRGLQQISDNGAIATLVQDVIQNNAGEVASYLAGKETLSNWFFGQVMRSAKGQANPQVVRNELERQLAELKENSR